MAFDFPNTPVNGQEFTPSGGPTYVFQSPRWVVKSVSQIATADARSRVVNGAMQITQEIAKNTGTSVASGAAVFIADQWVVNHVSAASPSAAVSQVAPLIPDSSWRLRVNSGATPDTSIAPTDACRIFQHIEGTRIADFAWGTASARQVVLRFTARSSKTGTFCVALRNSASDRSYIRNCTVAAANTDQEFTLVIPGDVTGTWTTDTGYGVLLYFTLSSGANTGVEGWQAGNLQATSAISNFLGTASATFDLTRVGFYLDPNNTGVAPPWVMPDEADELIACLRYWWGPVNFAVYPAATSTSIVMPAMMRITPAVTGGGTGFSVASPSQWTMQPNQTTLSNQPLKFNSRM